MLIEIKVPQLSESVAEATLLAWHKKVGEAVKPGEVIATLDTEGKASAAAPAVQAQAKAAPAPVPAAKPTPAAAPAMPSARKLAEEKGIDAGSIAGSGRGGRVTKADVLGAKSAPQPEAPAAVKPS